MIFAFLFFLFLDSPISLEPVGNQFIVWNVGQGQWLTLLEEETCWHFDSGGEQMDWSGLKKICQKRQNRFLYTHWDLDHISFAKVIARHLDHFCLEELPQGPDPGAKKQNLFRRWPLCPEQSRKPFVDLFLDTPSNSQNQNSKKILANDYSRVWLINQHILIAGDSPLAKEKIWREKITKQNKIDLFVLGHHGSRTSTSKELLNKLTSVKYAIASCRFKKYGHPHSQTLNKIAKAKKILLKTEDWGSLHFPQY